MLEDTCPPACGPYRRMISSWRVVFPSKSSGGQMLHCWLLRTSLINTIRSFKLGGSGIMTSNSCWLGLINVDESLATSNVTLLELLSSSKGPGFDSTLPKVKFAYNRSLRFRMRKTDSSTRPAKEASSRYFWVKN